MFGVDQLVGARARPRPPRYSSAPHEELLGGGTFGVLFPPAHSRQHPDDRSAFQAQVLVDADEDPRVEACVRFLHVVERGLTLDGEPVGQAVVGDRLEVSWVEAVEREVVTTTSTQIVIGGSRLEKPLGQGASFVRSWEPLRGRLELSSERVEGARFRVTARFANESAWAGADREDAQRHALWAAHVVLRVDRGAFVSAREAEGCVNEGVWPVLVGNERTVLASPVILSDYPQVTSESPGDLFDSTEIDRLLIANVVSLTEDEQAAMRATDPRAAEILDRCASLTRDQLLSLHGVMR